MSGTKEKLTVDQIVKRLLVDALGVDEVEITPKANLVNDLGADSLDSVELIMALEEKFDFEIPDDDAEKLQTVEQIVSYIEKNKK